MTRRRTGELAAGSERRAAPRHAIEVPIEITSGRDMALHVTRDLSTSGAYFHRAIPYAAGARVRLRIELPGEKSALPCEGEIVNVPDANTYGMGVRFIGLSEDDARRIERFVAAFAGP